MKFGYDKITDAPYVCDATRWVIQLNNLSSICWLIQLNKLSSIGRLNMFNSSVHYLTSMICPVNHLNMTSSSIKSYWFKEPDLLDSLGHESPAEQSKQVIQRDKLHNPI